MSVAGEAVCEVPLCALREWSARSAFVESSLSVVGPAEFRICAASRDFVTYATDVPANTPFLGTLFRPIRLDQSIIGGFGFGELAVTWGEIELSNAEADYDTLAFTHGVEGRRVRVMVGKMIGKTMQPYSSFHPIADLTATNWHIDNNVLRIFVRDNGFLLEVPAQPQTYDGTGNLNGGADLEGKRKPWPFGPVKNLTPAPVIPEELVYAVSWRSVQDITAAYDGGYALEFEADYPTSSALRASTTIVGGQFGTCIAEALIRLGAATDKQFTCDVEGDNVGGYVETTADIVRRVLVVAAGLDDDEDFDDVSFDLLNAQQGATIAYYLDHNSNETVAEVVRRLMGGIGGWGGFNRRRKFYVQRFSEPGIAPVASYDRTYFVDFVREALPDSVDPPPKRVRVPYERNWTVQTDLIPEVGVTDPARVAYLASPYRLASTPESAMAIIVADHPRAQDPGPIEAFFALKADAEAEEERLRDLYSGATRSLYRGKVKSRQFLHVPGQTIFVAYPRFELDDGVFGKIVEVKDDAERNETEVVFFV